jgi:putative endonuclease
MERMEQLWNDKGSEKSFVTKYFCYELLFYEKFKFYKDALNRKREIKGMNRKEKLKLIRKQNQGLRRFRF